MSDGNNGGDENEMDNLQVEFNEEVPKKSKSNIFRKRNPSLMKERGEQIIKTNISRGK